MISECLGALQASKQFVTEAGPIHDRIELLITLKCVKFFEETLKHPRDGYDSLLCDEHCPKCS